MDRRFLRPGWIAAHLLVLAAALTCLRLGWWQWERAHESDGTAQNLGYSMLWPVFAGAFIYMWIRFLRLEKIKQSEDDEQADHDLAELMTEIDPPAASGTVEPAASGTVEPAASGTVEPAADGSAEPAGTDRQRPSEGYVLSVATVDDEDPDDPELTAYNQALAALAEEDRRRARRPRR